MGFDRIDLGLVQFDTEFRFQRQYEPDEPGGIETWIFRSTVRP